MEKNLRELEAKDVYVPPVSMLDFCMALKATSPSVTEAENQKYLEYKKMMDKE
jgi:hypothetical protein